MATFSAVHLNILKWPYYHNLKIPNMSKILLLNTHEKALSDRIIGSHQSHLTNYMWRFSTQFSFSLCKNVCGRLHRDILDPCLSKIGWMQEVQCIKASCHQCYALQWFVTLKSAKNFMKYHNIRKYMAILKQKSLTLVLGGVKNYYVE